MPKQKIRNQELATGILFVCVSSSSSHAHTAQSATSTRTHVATTRGTHTQTQHGVLANVATVGRTWGSATFATRADCCRRRALLATCSPFTHHLAAHTQQDQQSRDSTHTTRPLPFGMLFRLSMPSSLLMMRWSWRIPKTKKCRSFTALKLFLALTALATSPAST